MLREAELEKLTEEVLGAWNEQDVEKVVACYTRDLVYRDPNTRGEVRGADAFRRYLRKLFQTWRMRWSPGSVYPLATGEGAAVLWHATIQKAGGDQRVEVDGMDLVLTDGRLIKRNEVYFDRAVLAPLVGM